MIYHSNSSEPNGSSLFTINNRILKYKTMKRLLRLLPYSVIGRITSVIIYLTLVLDRLEIKLRHKI